MINLLSLLDDIAATMDDVAVMTKVALEKTTALMTDDLAVNAGVVQGVESSRELPIVGQIFLGSIINKIITIFIILLISNFYPPLLSVLLFLGGCYLSFEGVDKIYEKITSPKKNQTNKKNVTEKQKIWGAIKTDFVLSLEIILLAKSTISGTFLKQLISLGVVGLSASLIIYGLVAILVKVDDFGVFLIKHQKTKIGLFLINITPKMMKSLGVIGTTAMLIVGGSIISHLFHFPVLIFDYIQNLFIGIILGLFILMIKIKLKP